MHIQQIKHEAYQSAVNNRQHYCTANIYLTASQSTLMDDCNSVQNADVNEIICIITLQMLN